MRDWLLYLEKSFIYVFILAQLQFFTQLLTCRHTMESLEFHSQTMTEVEKTLKSISV